MNRWQAIEAIVTRYIEKGHPGYALAALALLLIALILLTGFGVTVLAYAAAPAWMLLS